MLDLKEGAHHSDLTAAMQDRVIATTTLTGLYGTKKENPEPKANEENSAILH